MDDVILVTNNSPVEYGWGRYELPPNTSAYLPLFIAEKLKGKADIIVHQNIEEEYQVNIDCMNPSGGIRSHINYIKQFCNQKFDEKGKIIHWHFMGKAKTNIDVATCHGYYTKTFIKKHGAYANEVNDILIETFKNTKYVISVSEWIQNGLRNEYGIDSIVIRNGIDSIKYHNKEYGEYILFSSYDCPEKNIDDAITIASKLNTIPFVFITDKNVSFLNNVTQYKYPLPHEKFVDLLEKCRFLLITSLQEAGPIIAMEAAAASKGVVAFNTPGINEIVKHKRTGLLANNRKHIIDMCNTMYKSPEIFGKNARKLAPTFDWRFLASRLDNIYNACKYPNKEYPSVSVSIVTYKDYDKLIHAIESFPKWCEIIVIDVSKDQRYYVPDYCRYYQVDNVYPRSKNIGVQLATKKYIINADGHDLRFPGTIEQQYKYLEEHDDVVATSGQVYRDGSILWQTKTPLEITNDMFLHGNPVAHGSLMIRRDAMLAIGGYDESLYRCEDYDMAWRLLEIGKIVRLPIIAYNWTTHANNASSDKEGEQVYIKKVIEKARARGVI